MIFIREIDVPSSGMLVAVVVLKDLWWWDCCWGLGVGARDTAKHPNAPHTWGELFQPKASSTPDEKHCSRQLADVGYLGGKYGIWET